MTMQMPRALPGFLPTLSSSLQLTLAMTSRSLLDPDAYLLLEEGLTVWLTSGVYTYHNTLSLTGLSVFPPKKMPEGGDLAGTCQKFMQTKK